MIIHFSLSDLFEIMAIGVFAGIILTFIIFSIGMIFHIFKKISS